MSNLTAHLPTGERAVESSDYHMKSSLKYKVERDIIPQPDISTLMIIHTNKLRKSLFMATKWEQMTSDILVHIQRERQITTLRSLVRFAANLCESSKKTLVPC